MQGRHPYQGCVHVCPFRWTMESCAHVALLTAGGNPGWEISTSKEDALESETIIILDKSARNEHVMLLKFWEHWKKNSKGNFRENLQPRQMPTSIQCAAVLG